MEIKFLVITLLGDYIELPDSILKEFNFPNQDDVKEHFISQYIHKVDNEDHVYQPILLGMKNDDFINFINKISDLTDNPTTYYKNECDIYGEVYGRIILKVINDEK